MPSIVKKRIKGQEYLYLVTSIRKNNKVIQKTLKYIGKKRPIDKNEFKCMQLSANKDDWILNNFIEELSYSDHKKLNEASKNYKSYLNSRSQILKEKEKEKFLSQFISNSNAIEGSTLTQSETFNLLFKDISPRGHTKKEIHMATNLLKAWNYIEENQNRMPNKKDLLILHSFVNREIENDKTLGKFKTAQNYIDDVHTTSFLYVEDRINELLIWIKKAFNKIDNFEVAFQSHSQFELIHPFEDGNGRVGRLLMNWLLMYKKLSYFSISIKKRSDYLSALKNSQKGKIEAICKFCFKEYMNQHNFFLDFNKLK